MKLLLFLITFNNQQLPDSVKFWKAGTVMVSDWFVDNKDFIYFRVDLPHQKTVEIRLKTDSKIVGGVYLSIYTGIIELRPEKVDRFGFISFYLHQYNKNEWDNPKYGLLKIEFLTIDGKSHRIWLKNYNLTKFKNYAN